MAIAAARRERRARWPSQFGARRRGRSLEADERLGDAEDGVSVDEILLAPRGFAQGSGGDAIDLAQGPLGVLVDAGRLAGRGLLELAVGSTMRSGTCLPSRSSVGAPPSKRLVATVTIWPAR
jgi:hypothetical protein